MQGGGVQPPGERGLRSMEAVLTNHTDITSKREISRSPRKSDGRFVGQEDGIGREAKVGSSRDDKVQCYAEADGVDPIPQNAENPSVSYSLYKTGQTSLVMTHAARKANVTTTNILLVIHPTPQQPR